MDKEASSAGEGAHNLPDSPDSPGKTEETVTYYPWAWGTKNPRIQSNALHGRLTVTLSVQSCTEDWPSSQSPLHYKKQKKIALVIVIPTKPFKSDKENWARTMIFISACRFLGHMTMAHYFTVAYDPRENLVLGIVLIFGVCKILPLQMLSVMAVLFVVALAIFFWGGVSLRMWYKTKNQ